MPRVADAPSTGAGPKISARERILAAANDLFYREGVHTVGIDRIIQEAGVAKASLYDNFRNKDALVTAYLERRRARVMSRVQLAVDAQSDPRERVLAVFDAQASLMAEPEFNGCAFSSATSETHSPSIDEATAAYRDWFRNLLTELASAAGADDPAALARQLHLLYDGAGQLARMDGDVGAAAAARAAAAILLDNSTPFDSTTPPDSTTVRR
jgi:AcrR family transcriptional regulator